MANDKKQALAGLRRIALGRSNDAARLALGGLAPEEVDALDLFAVSEIKRSREGGCDVKLYDRLEALRLLLEHAAKAGGEEMLPLLEALERGARAVEALPDDDAV